LRKIFVDPMTGKAEWGVIWLGDKIGVLGVYSLSNARPLKVANFDIRFLNMENREKISDWKFLMAGGEGAVNTQQLPPNSMIGTAPPASLFPSATPGLDAGGNSGGKSGAAPAAGAGTGKGGEGAPVPPPVPERQPGADEPPAPEPEVMEPEAEEEKDPAEDPPPPVEPVEPGEQVDQSTIAVPPPPPRRR
jgi:hypothetical protein